MNQELISIIIPNFNGVRFLKDCYESLKNQSYKNIEIFLVDNNSTDSSISFTKKNYPYIKILSLKENFGFSKAVNEGIINSSGKYIILLNNDTSVHKDFVLNLYNAISSRNSIGSVASKMIQMYMPEKMDSAGDLYNILGWGVNIGQGQSSKKYNKPYRIFSACAGASIYRKDLFDEIGLFDENHFAYMEDIDIGYRLRIYGYTNLYEPKAICYHVGSGTSGSKYNSFKVKLSSRNNIYLNYKNMPLFFLIINFLPLVLGYFIKYLFFKKKGFHKDYIDGIREGFKNVRKLNKIKFTFKHLKNYIIIEWELLINLFKYVGDYIIRKISKSGNL